MLDRPVVNAVFDCDLQKLVTLHEPGILAISDLRFDSKRGLFEHKVAITLKMPSGFRFCDHSIAGGQLVLYKFRSITFESESLEYTELELVDLESGSRRRRVIKGSYFAELSYFDKQLVACKITKSEITVTGVIV